MAPFHVKADDRKYLTEFQTKVFTKCFEQLDNNADGVLDNDDVSKSARRLLDESGQEALDKEKLEKYFDALWTTISQNKKKVELSEYLDFVGAVASVVHETGSLPSQILDGEIDSLFDLLQPSTEGDVSWDNFKRYGQALNKKEDETRRIYEDLTRKGALRFSKDLLALLERDMFGNIDPNLDIYLWPNRINQ